MFLFKASAGLIALLAAAAAPGPRLEAALPAAPPSHVLIVIEENHGFGDIIGAAAAPYFNALARGGALMTQSFAVTHPSEPNYLELFSGSTQGVSDDSCPNGFTAPNLGGQLLAAHRTFAGYSEDLPAAGYTGCASAAYARKHNPWSMFADVPAASNLPFTAFPSDHFQDLPTVAFVVPNLDHDMHDGSIQAADSWLQANLDGYVQWARANNSLLIVTFDEDDNTGGSNRITTIFSGPMVKPGRYGEIINHDNVLRTVEDLYGLGHAGRTGSTAPITDIWTSVQAGPYTIAASAGPNGSITPSGSVAVAAGGSQTFNIDAAPGYVTSSVLVDSADQGPICAYTFSSVAAGHTIAAAFTLPGQYTITASAGAGGAIAPSGVIPIASGGSQTFSITPAAGFSISAVTVDGVSKGAISTYTFSNVMASHTISAAFSAPASQYTITASAGTGGSITPSGAVAVAGGASQTFAIAAAAGYTISAVTVDGVGQGAISTYTFSNVAASHTISAAFAASSSGGKVISIDFVGRGTIMAATETAGVYPRSHWNNAQGAVQSTAQSLLDETGAATGAKVSWSASGVWSLPGTGTSNDMHMMSGYLDAAGANTIVRISGLPASAAGYAVLVYADGDNSSATRSGIYQISGSGITTTNITLTDAANSNFTGTYVQAAHSAGNFVKFITTATAFNLTAIPSTSSDAYPRAPINGIQIVPLAGSAGR